MPNVSGVKNEAGDNAADQIFSEFYNDVRVFACETEPEDEWSVILKRN